MEQIQAPCCLPTLEMVADALLRAGIPCRSAVRDKEKTYRGVRLYSGQPLRQDVIYLLTGRETDFPVDVCAYVSGSDIPGAGDHLYCPGSSREALLDLLQEYFSAWQEARSRIDQLVLSGAGLQELCQLGETLLENPVCIHDDWFIMIAMSAGVRTVMMPEYVASSEKGFVPRAIVEDFKHDSDYLETYAHREAKIWSGPQGTPSSLYVNLWEGSLYRGRLLVFRQNREFRRQDFLLAEFLAQRAVSLLGRQDLGQYQGMDGVIYKILAGDLPDPADLGRLLKSMRWDLSDRYLCARLRPQETGETTLLDHALHSELFQAFPGSYILLTGCEQCLLLNTTREPVSPVQFRHRLAPLCRDYCLYAGISSPAAGLRDLHLAYCQAEAAIDRAFQLRGEKWILLFSDCAMDYLLDSLDPPLLPQHLVAPGLMALAAHDREKGTQYFETLRAYLLHERNIPETAQALIIHRTTLLYRLKKIQPLLGMDLEDPWQRLYLTLSLWILERQAGVPSRPAGRAPAKE